MEKSVGEKTIGNPLSWSVQTIGSTASYVTSAIGSLGVHARSAALPTITINEIDTDDLRDALSKGMEDFAAYRGDVIFICLLYPVMGLILAGFAFNMNLLPLLFPLAAGFALLGPLAAVGLYEISRRRELGLDATWGSAFGIVASPSFAAIVLLGLYLLAIFLVWMMAAHGIYSLTLGPEPPESIGSFLTEVLTTGAGWTMIVVGIAVGFVFAVVVLAMSVVSFPLLLDREVGVPAAIVTSVQVAQKNMRAVFTWGLIVAIGLVLGSIPLLIGLVIVMPVLGHATWHLYRKAVTIEGP